MFRLFKYTRGAYIPYHMSAELNSLERRDPVAYVLVWREHFISRFQLR